MCENRAEHVIILLTPQTCLPHALQMDAMPHDIAIDIQYHAVFQPIEDKLRHIEYHIARYAVCVGCGGSYAMWLSLATGVESIPQLMPEPLWLAQAKLRLQRSQEVFTLTMCVQFSCS